MPHHDWSDDTFDWNSLNEAIRYCMTTWKLWGRIGTHGKEKYGTFRDHIYMWDGTIWTLAYPGYVWVKPGFWSFWYYKVDTKLIQPFMIKTRLIKLGWWWQAQVYNYAVQKACRRYPHIIDEIVSHLDGYEMVKPNIFGQVDGKVIHEKYWTSV